MGITDKVGPGKPSISATDTDSPELAGQSLCSTSQSAFAHCSRSSGVARKQTTTVRELGRQV
jgi:hypothetical protein